jgi:hypothetical protein
VQHAAADAFSVPSQQALLSRQQSLAFWQQSGAAEQHCLPSSQQARCLLQQPALVVAVQQAFSGEQQAAFA